MTINYAILGILSCRPMTGYDLKKIIQDSAFMYWSGNNNQIYKTLVELLKDGYVTNEVQYSESSPPRKIYTITGEGMDSLQNWLRSEISPSELKNPFLIRLAWADTLGEKELSAMLKDYENDVRLQLLMQRGKFRRGNDLVPRNGLQAFLWKSIEENILSFYQAQLDWIQNVSNRLPAFCREEGGELSYQVAGDDKRRIVEVFLKKTPLKSERDALELIALCGRHDANRLILHGEALCGDFFDLKTGVAGAVLQKFINYSVRVAVVARDTSGLGQRFAELMYETDRGGHYRFFSNRADAENWLMKG